MAWYVVLPAGAGQRRVKACGQINPAAPAWAAYAVVQLTGASLTNKPNDVTSTRGTSDYLFNPDTGTWTYQPA
jgi:hypothetical protein